MIVGRALYGILVDRSRPHGSCQILSEATYMEHPRKACRLREVLVCVDDVVLRPWADDRVHLRRVHTVVFVVFLKVGTAFMRWGTAHLVSMVSVKHCPEGGACVTTIDTRTSVGQRVHHAF